MAVVLEQDQWGWVRPVFKRGPHLEDWSWDDFMRPPFQTANGQMLNLPDFGMPRCLTDYDLGNSTKFEVKLDVHQFAPEELDVKVVDNFLVIQGKHEEKNETHNYVTRSFLRKQQLPSNVKPENVVCDLSSDGVLNISAPKEHDDKAAKEKIIPIVVTGQPALR